MSKLTDKEVIQILRTALLCELYDRSQGRVDQAGAVGVVHAFNRGQEDEQWYIIKFEVQNGWCDTWGIIPIKPNEYKNGSLLYYHETEADVVTYAALWGDGIVEEDDGHPE